MHKLAYKNILVCVTQQKTCERLIRKAAEQKEENSANLFVLHVAKNSWNFLDNVHEGEALEHLFAISKSVGANLTVLKSDEILSAITNFSIQNKIDCIFMGQPQNDHKENNFSKELKIYLPEVNIEVIP